MKCFLFEVTNQNGISKHVHIYADSENEAKERAKYLSTSFKDDDTLILYEYDKPPKEIKN